MKMIIYPYKMQSQSAKKLAKELGAKRVYPDGKYKFSPDDYIINWGSTKYPDWLPYGHRKPGMFKNMIQPVMRATYKALAFNTLQESGILVPEWTIWKVMARAWLTEGKTVVARTKVAGHSGDGIMLVQSTNDELPDCDLYTVYKKKTKEFRVHVMLDKVIDVQQKKLKSDAKDKWNHQIRTHDNGWVFCRSDVQLPEHVLDMAKRAVCMIGLHFGAVDIIWNRKEDKYYVLEVNTAPGLEGTTLTNYVKAFKDDSERYCC